MKKKVLLIVISIIIILIVGIITAIIILNNNSNKNEERVLSPQEKEEGYKVKDPEIPSDINAIEEVKEDYSLKVDYVKVDANYFTVQAIAENYASMVMYSNKEGLKKMIAPSFIKKYNINDKNILNVANIPKSESERYIFLSDIKECINSEKSLYFVSGKGILLNNNKMFNYKIMIELDVVNQKYIIYPEKYLIDNRLNNIKIGDTINKKHFEDIKENEGSKFIYIEEKTDLEMAQKLVYDFKQLLVYDKENAFNHLDNNYSKKRFENKDNFNKYYEENKITLAIMSVDKYKVKKEKEYTDYIIADKYKNIYTIRKNNSISNYSVFLDNYTILSKDDSEKYNNADSKEKARLNLNKFLNMLNTKDYTAIYKVLNPTFRQNNYKSIDELKKYIQNNFYNLNSISISKTTDNNNYYVFKCNVKNLRNTKESKDINIIISKTDTTDFNMSFSF